MAKEKNGKVNVTSFKISKELHEQIKLLADEDLRSVNAQIIYILTKTLQEEKWQQKINEILEKQIHKVSSWFISLSKIK